VRKHERNLFGWAEGLYDMMMEVRDSLNRGLINQSANGRPKFKDKFLFGTKHSSRVLEYKYKYADSLVRVRHNLRRY